MSDLIPVLYFDMATTGLVERIKASPAAAPFRIFTPESDSQEDLIRVAPQAQAILCYKAELPGSLIRAATSLKFIQKYGVNCKNIDVAAATQRGVPVAIQNPLWRNVSVAEQALALMLACARKVIPGHRAVAEAEYLGMGLEPTQTTQYKIRPNWVKIEGMAELFDSTLGIIGLGDIGMEIAKRCRAFGMKIHYYQRTPHPPKVEKAYKATYLPLNELLAVSDYVVLVIPHTPESDGIMGREQFARMKPTATFINVGRGPLVDEEALVEALQNKRIAMAGSDVYRMEPLPESSPLRKLPNVVLLPHTGGGSYRSWAMDIPACLNNIHRFFQGKKPRGIINKGALR
jgi:glyoxylate reductase